MAEVKASLVSLIGLNRNDLAHVRKGHDKPRDVLAPLPSAISAISFCIDILSVLHEKSICLIAIKTCPLELKHNLDINSMYERDTI
jgi:hypothetical protein